MTGTYFRTVDRDDATGYTKFLFCPKEFCMEAEDGLILCTGVTPYTDAQMPLDIQGSFNNGIYQTEHISPDFHTDSILKYLLGISDNERNKIRRVLGDDFELYIKTHGTEDLKKLLPEQFTRLMQGFNSIKNTEALFSLHEKMQVPYPAVEKLMAHDISLQRIRKNPYLYLNYYSIYDAEHIEAYFNPSPDPYNMKRVKGYITDALSLTAKNGHSCYPFGKLCRVVHHRTKNSLYPDDLFSASFLYSHISSFKEKCHMEVIDEELYIYDKKIWEQESVSIIQCRRLQAAKKDFVKNIDIDKIEQINNIHYNDGQKKAFRLLKTTGLKIISGPPGSGKTSLIKGLVTAYKEEYPMESVIFLATTGAAAQVIKRSTGWPGETIHKNLGIRPDTGFVEKDINNPIDALFIIADEISMIDLATFTHLVSAAKSGALVLLVGDADQLQSVEYGNVLHDLIHSQFFEVYHLTEVLRQSGYIFANAQKIKEDNANLACADTFHIYKFHDAQELLNKVLSLYSPKDGIVLTPVRKESLGIYSLNEKLQAASNKSPVLFRYGRHIYREGDHIIMEETNYEKGYFNGDIGILKTMSGSQAVAEFYDKTLLLDREDFPKMSLAYSITIHKAQGSEKDHVHIILPEEPKNMLTWRLLYTAVTRAKKKVFLYCMGNALETAIHNRTDNKRYSNLAARLCAAMPNIEK